MNSEAKTAVSAFRSRTRLISSSTFRSSLGCCSPRPRLLCLSIRSVSTLTEGNELDGSFYLTYHCEKAVTSVRVTVAENDLVFELAAAGVVEVGDTIRVDTNSEASGDDVTTSWRYFTVSAVDGTFVTVESDATVDFEGDYDAEYGDFFSGPGEEHGVSTACLTADPDFTNNPLAHNVDASDLQNELQGLAQVNSADGCLEVRSAALKCYLTLVAEMLPWGH